MAKRPTAAPTLLILDSSGAADRFVTLDRDVLVIGRDPSCDLVLGRDRKVVSGEHARIVRRADGYFIEDLDSRNGTYVDGRKVAGPEPLADGRRIHICNYTLVFNQPSVHVRDDDSSSTILGSLDASSDDQLAPTLAARPEEKLRGVLEIGRSLGGTLSLREVLDRTLEALFRIFPQADRGFVLLGDRADSARALLPDAIRVRGDDPNSLTISRTVFDRVVNDGQAILSTDATKDSRLLSDSVASARIRTMMCVPLLDNRRRPIGILQLDARDDRGRFDQEDLDLLVAVAGQVAMALENTRLHEALLDLMRTRQETRDAAEVQKALLPRARPEVGGYAFWDDYEPARFVGGDYFDYLPLGRPAGVDGPDRLAIAMGDVTGKGMPAALLMARFSTEVRLFTRTGGDPAQIVGRLNRGLCDIGVGDRFITFLLVALDAPAHRITVVNAGHMDPLIRRAEGRVETLGRERGNLPVGVVRSVAYETISAGLGPGDVVVLYTDGVTDALDVHGHPFGMDRLRRAVLGAPAGPAAVGQAILGAVRDYVAGHPQYDDITLLCFGRT